MDAVEEKVLVYLGPSLSLAKAREILPGATYRPPAKQGDILSDVVNLEPTHIILVDGEFRQNLSPWHKEIVYALQFPGVKAVYGSSSMGALRASELDFVGMIGVGTVYKWYRDRITEDDSEVALSYTSRARISLKDGPIPEEAIYFPLTVPLCDIRAGMYRYQKEFEGQPVAAESRRFFEAMQRVHYMDRTQNVCEQFWGGRFDGVTFPYLPQKELDAIQVLTEFRDLKPEPLAKPTPEHLSLFFQALYDRDRKVVIQGHSIAQQHIDSYVMLHNPEYERIAWDAANQELALMLCDCLCVTVGPEEIDAESRRFWQRAGVETAAEFSAMLAANGWTKNEYERLIIQNARIHKLQHSVSVTKTWRRNTRSVLDYLRTHQAFDYWAAQVAKLETRIKQNGAEDWLGIDLDKTAFAPLAEHFDHEGLDLKMTPEDYLLETGFSNQTELAMALQRISAGKEES
jgi:hypothetical protein